ASRESRHDCLRSGRAQLCRAQSALADSPMKLARCSLARDCQWPLHSVKSVARLYSFWEAHGWIVRSCASFLCKGGGMIFERNVRVNSLNKRRRLDYPESGRSLMMANT